MDGLRTHLTPILKEMEVHYGWFFETAALEYLMHYFHSLDRYPTSSEVMLCAVRARNSHQKPIMIPGHKIDAFYAHSTVLETSKPDLLDTPEIPSDVKPSNVLLQEKMVDEAASRAHTLMASSIRLPRRVVSVLEEQYWVENNYTARPGYHHYEHSESKSDYGFAFNPVEIPGAFSSRGGWVTFYGDSLDGIAAASKDCIRRHNQSGFPLLSAQFRKKREAECISTGFTNVLPCPDEERKIKPGDRLFLLGKLSDQREAALENQLKAVIFNAYALEEGNPIFRTLSLEHQSLLSAILSVMSQSIPGCGVHVSLDIIPKPNADWGWEDFWTKPLVNNSLVVVPDYQKHVLIPLIDREDCPCIEIGEVTELGEVVFLRELHENPITRLEWEFLEHFPIHSTVDTQPVKAYSETPVAERRNDFSNELEFMLKQLSITDKSFLVTQMDRTCTGLVARDVMVGPWQVPVADVGVTLTEFKDYRGEALAEGSASLSSAVDTIGAAKVALSEALTGLSAAAIVDISAAHFMIPESVCSLEVYEVLTECVESWGASVNKVAAYLSDPKKMALDDIAITAFAPVMDVRKTLTPQWVTDDETDLIAVIWESQAVENLKPFFKAIQTLNKDDLLLAYHDLSEGGLARCLLEMAFCSHCGFSVNLSDISPFTRYSGAVLQIRRSSQLEVTDFLNRCGFEGKIHYLGAPLSSDEVIFCQNATILYEGSRTYLHRLWSLPGIEAQKRQSDPLSADLAYQALLDPLDPGLHEKLTFDPNQNIILPYIGDVKPSVAVLRFPGGLGHLEMAAAFDRAGFECIDVSIIDILSGEEDLKPYSGLVIGGSAMDGNVLPFTDSVLAYDQVRKVFEQFFQRPHTFTLGVGDGCQWLASIKDWVPGADHWPSFQSNASGRFEGRWALVKVRSSPSIFLQGMEGALMPVPVACEQGRLLFPDVESIKALEHQQLIPLVYADHYERITERYPFNPTGSQLGTCGFSSQDGRVLGIVGHPERACRSSQQSWHYRYLQMDAPWLRLFRNARKFVGSTSGVTFFDPTA